MSSLKFNKPITPSSRHTVSVLNKYSKVRPQKSLLAPKISTGGRNAQGRITTRFRGSGNKTQYRIIAFKKTLFEVYAEVMTIEYDPNRNVPIVLLKYENGLLEYSIFAEGMFIGQKVMNSKFIESVSLKPGNYLPLSEIPMGTNISCVEFKPGGGAKIARSAGAFVQLVGKENGKAILKMPSSETRFVEIDCLAMIGAVGNAQYQNIKIGKAGRNRWKGFRGHVRGEVMNPVDHPLGGRTRGGRHPVSPWGQIAKGLKTRTNKLTNKFIIKRRVKKNK